MPHLFSMSNDFTGAVLSGPTRVSPLTRCVLCTFTENINAKQELLVSSQRGGKRSRCTHQRRRLVLVRSQALSVAQQGRAGAGSTPSIHFSWVCL